MNVCRSYGSVALIALLCLLLANCTIVRDSNGENNDENNDDNAWQINDEEPPFNDIPIDAKVVDAVVFVELTRAHSGIAAGYHAFLNEVQIALAATHGIFVRDLAVAPMYRRHGHRAPLLYGRGDDNNLQHSLEESLAYYLTDEGRGHLDDRVDAPAENTAALGMELAQEPVYNPEAGSGDGSPYFTSPEDGFIVFYITGSERDCSHDDADCAINGDTPAEYFMQSDSEGGAQWLSLPGGSVEPDQIAHATITTEEGVSYEEFSERCTGRPDFPRAYLDFMEPSDNLFFEPLVSDINAAGGVATHTDMCTALSSGLDGAALTTAADIANAVR